MIPSAPRITANRAVAHVHFASISTKFNVSFDKDSGSHVIFCMDDDNKSTCELHVGQYAETVQFIKADLLKLGYKQF